MGKSAVVGWRKFDDLPGVRAWQEETIEDGKKEYYLVVEQDGEIVCRQFLPTLTVIEWEKEVKEIIADREWGKKVADMICPDCGGKLVKSVIEEGRHKGHGTISCSECERVLVRA